MGEGMTWAAQARPLRRKRRYGPARQMMPPTLLRRYTGRRHLLPGERELADAVGWFDAKDLASTTQQTLPNRADGGATTAQFGSTAGADSSDPGIRLPDPLGPYAAFPASIGANLTLAGSTPSDTSTVEHIARVRTPINVGLCYVAGTGSTHLTVRLDSADGAMVIHHLDTAAAVVGGYNSPVMPGFNPDNFIWCRWKLNTTSGLCEYWYSHQQVATPEEVTWIFLGSGTGSTTGNPPLTANIHQHLVGSYSTGLSGNLMDIAYSRRIWGGVTHSTWSCDVTHVGTNSGFTINRPNTNTKPLVIVAGRPVIITDPTDDHLVLPASLLPSHVTPTTGAFTLVVLSRTWPNAATTTALFGSGNTAFEGLSLYESSGVSLIATARDSGSGLVTATISAVGGSGELKVKGMLVDNGTIAPFASGHTSPTPVSMAGLIDINFGTTPKVSSAYGNASTGNGRAGEYYSVAMWNRALSPAERAAVSAYLEAGSY